MGCAGSKHQQPKSEKKKSSSNIVTDTRGTSSVLITKETKITHQVYSTRASTSSSRTSQTIAPTSSPTASVSARTYTPVYKRPTMTAAIDASRPFSYLQPPESYSNKALLPASKNATYDLSKSAYVLVFHHDKFKNTSHNRKGSAKDLEKLRNLLLQYRCDRVDVNENFTKAKVESKMEEISKRDFSKHSCLIVFIMSHGNANDTIMAHDGKFYSFQSDVVENCTKNRTLNDKPKVFVLQACRGDAQIVTDATPAISNKVDLVIFQSSYQGAVSYRDQQNGSFFMQAFLRLLHEHNGESIVKINPLLNDEFTRNSILQTPTLMTTLRKDFVIRDLLRSR